jgi:hypothetical protein
VGEIDPSIAAELLQHVCLPKVCVYACRHMVHVILIAWGSYTH